METGKRAESISVNEQAVRPVSILPPCTSSGKRRPDQLCYSNIPQMYILLKKYVKNKIKSRISISLKELNYTYHFVFNVFVFKKYIFKVLLYLSLKERSDII